MARPFIPFVIRLEGGFEIRVIHHEFATLEPGVLIATVFDSEGRFEVFEVDRIVSLKTIDSA
jgi:hypothetical protein